MKASMLQRNNSTQQNKFHTTERTHVPRSDGPIFIVMIIMMYLAAFWATCVTLKGTCQTKQKHDPMKHLKNVMSIKTQVGGHMC